MPIQSGQGARTKCPRGHEVDASRMLNHNARFGCDRNGGDGDIRLHSQQEKDRLKYERLKREQEMLAQRAKAAEELPTAGFSGTGIQAIQRVASNSDYLKGSQNYGILPAASNSSTFGGTTEPDKPVYVAPARRPARTPAPDFTTGNEKGKRKYTGIIPPGCNRFGASVSQPSNTGELNYLGTGVSPFAPIVENVIEAPRADDVPVVAPVQQQQPVARPSPPAAAARSGRFPLPQRFTPRAIVPAVVGETVPSVIGSGMPLNPLPSYAQTLADDPTTHPDHLVNRISSLTLPPPDYNSSSAGSSAGSSTVSRSRFPLPKYNRVPKSA